MHKYKFTKNEQTNQQKKQSLDVWEEETLDFTQLQIGLRCLVFQDPIRLSQVKLVFLPQFLFSWGKNQYSSEFGTQDIAGRS